MNNEKKLTSKLYIFILTVGQRDVIFLAEISARTHTYIYTTFSSVLPKSEGVSEGSVNKRWGRKNFTTFHM